MEFLNIIVGSFITLISLYFANHYQLKRDELKYLRDKELEKDKRNSENEVLKINEFKKMIIEVSKLLTIIDMNISLTRSVIDSTKKITLEEFDEIYKLECETLYELNKYSILYLNEQQNTINNIINLYNNFWGNQRILIINSDKQTNSIILEKIIQISNDISTEINNLKFDLTELMKSKNI